MSEPLPPARPWAPRPSPAQIQLIDDLGGPARVAAIVAARTGYPLRPQAVSLWKRRGIPHGYRIHLVHEAVERGLAVPEGFLTDNGKGRA